VDGDDRRARARHAVLSEGEGSKGRWFYVAQSGGRRRALHGPKLPGGHGGYGGTPSAVATRFNTAFCW
jgi:hypothetical protein